MNDDEKRKSADRIAAYYSAKDRALNEYIERHQEKNPLGPVDYALWTSYKTLLESTDRNPQYEKPKLTLIQGGKK